MRLCIPSWNYEQISDLMEIQVVLKTVERKGVEGPYIYNNPETQLYY